MNNTVSGKGGIGAGEVLFAVPAALAVDTVWGLSSGWRPNGTIELLGTLLIATTILDGAAFLVIPRLRGLVSKYARELTLLTVSLLVCWTVLEAGAGRIEASLHRDAFFHTRGPGIQRTFIPAPGFIAGGGDPARFTTDAQGIRAPYPPDARHTFRILCVGGSTTESLYIDDTKTWPARLMDALNQQRGGDTVWVGNVGISGFDTRDHIRFLETSPLLEDIDCVVVQAGINDLWRYLANEEEHIRYDRFLPGVTPTPPDAKTPATPAVYRPLWTRSRVIQLYHTLRQERATPREAPKPETIEGVGGEEYRLRREKRAAAKIVDSLPELNRGVREYAERIRHIIRLCRKRGIQVVFTTQPVLWRTDLPPELEERCWFGWLENGDYLSLAALRAAMDRYNAALLEICGEEHVPCADLSEMNGNPAFFYDDCHFTIAGSEEVARRVAAVFGK